MSLGMEPRKYVHHYWPQEQNVRLWGQPSSDHSSLNWFWGYRSGNTLRAFCVWACPMPVVSLQLPRSWLWDLGTAQSLSQARSDADPPGADSVTLSQSPPCPHGQEGMRTEPPRGWVCAPAFSTCPYTPRTVRVVGWTARTPRRSALIPAACTCDFVWKKSLCRCD